MKLTASGRHAANFETKDVFDQMPPISQTTARGQGSQGPSAALINSLEASFPHADIAALRDVADRLARRITGPELDLTDLTDDEEDVVAIMSPATWDALQRIAQQTGAAGISSVALSPEFSSGGHTLVEGLQELAVEYLDVSVPADGDTIDFRNLHAERPQGNGLGQLTLNIRPGEPGSTLEQIYVPDGTMIKGSWEGSTNVLLHFTDAQGAVLRSTRMFQNHAGEWQQLRPMDLQCIERGDSSRQMFIDAARSGLPECSDNALGGFFDRWLRCIEGSVLDLSKCVGDEANGLLRLPTEAWAAFRGDPRAAELTTVLVSQELAMGRPLATDLHQQFNPDDPRTAFAAVASPALGSFPVSRLFDALVYSIEGSVLYLDDFERYAADALLLLPPSAWREFLRHPKAAHLTSVVLSDELSAGGLRIDGMNMRLYSSDRRQSPDPRKSFIAHVNDLPLGCRPDRLFDRLIRHAQGKTLHLRNFENAEALRLLPPEAWDAFLRHPRAAVLTTIKAKPELYLGGPLVPGLRMRLNLRDPRSAFVAATEQVFPGRPVYNLFDILVSRIHGDKLDLSDVSEAVPDLRSLPQSAWTAFFRHPKAANLTTIIASEALFVGGPMVDKLQNELAPEAPPVE